MLITIAFVLMGVMFFAGMYVAGALGSLALILLNLFSDNPVWNIMGNRAWETNTNVNLVAIPLFILMGEIVLRSGFADLMYRALSRWVDFIPGGLLHTNIASCAVFAACAGSSIATAATVSRVALPSFRAQGYEERLVVGSLAAGGTLGILIPPSILLVLYGLTVGESIGRLFLAGFIPGILLALVFMVMIGIVSVIWPAVAPRQSRLAFWTWEGWIERLLFTLLMIPVMALVFIVLGSIYFGWATPSEGPCPKSRLFRGLFGQISDFSGNCRTFRAKCLSPDCSMGRGAYHRPQAAETTPKLKRPSREGRTWFRE